MFISSILCLILYSHLSDATNQGKPSLRLPNFVILLSDDVGVGDLGYRNPQSLAKTPNIDKMASSSNTIIFSNMHSEAACTPTRAALLTGRSPLRDCVWTPVVLPQPTFPFQMPSVVKVARDVYGYRTLFLGKWPSRSTRMGPLSFPSDFGFEDYVVTDEGSTYDPACFCNDPSSRKCFIGHYRARTIRKFLKALPCWRIKSPDGQKFVEPPNVMEADELADSFVNWVNQINSNTDRYFAQVSFRSVHIPFVASPELRSACQNNTICNDLGRTKSSIQLDYGGVISSLDSAVGKIRDTLRKRDDWENTILIFLSDNGPEASFRGGAGSSGGLRGNKETLFEGLLRVPALLEWPAKIVSNHETFSMTSVLDIPMTFLDIVNNKEDGITRDGVSLMPIIVNPSTKMQRAKPLMVCSCSNLRQVKRNQGCVSLVHYDKNGQWKLFGNRANSNLSPSPSFLIPTMYFNLTYQGFGEDQNFLNFGFPSLFNDTEESNRWLSSIFSDFSVNCPHYYKG